MDDAAAREAVAELAGGLSHKASRIIREAFLSSEAGDLHLGDARVTLQLVLAAAEAKGVDPDRLAWPSLAAAIALLAARDADRLEARARCGFSHRELYWSLQSDMYGFHTGGVTGSRRFGRCLPCAIGKPGKCGASSAAWFCRRRLSLLDTRHLAPCTKTAALLMDGVTLLPSRSAGHVLARGLDASGQPQGPSRKTIGPPPGPQDDDRVSLFDRSTWSGERLGGTVALSDDKPETFVAQARTLLDSLQGMAPEQQWRQVSHACTKRYVGCLKRLAGKESRKRKQAHKGAEPPPLVETELAATELRRWPDYAFLMMAEETDDCLPRADMETSFCILNHGTRAAAAEMQPAAFGMPPWHLRPDMPKLRTCADSAVAQQQAPVYRRLSIPLRKSSAPLRRRGSAEARLQRPSAEQPAPLTALPSAAGGSPLPGGAMTAGSDVSGSAMPPLPPAHGPQAAYQHCNSFFARCLPEDDSDCWPAPQVGFGGTPLGAGQPVSWGTGLRATQSADCSLAPPQQQLPLAQPLLPTSQSVPVSTNGSYSQLFSGLLCSSGQICTDLQPCGGCLTIRTRSNPECVAMHSTLGAATDALPPRRYSLSMPLDQPAAVLQRIFMHHDMLPQLGGWHQFPAIAPLPPPHVAAAGQYDWPPLSSFMQLGPQLPQLQCIDDRSRLPHPPRVQLPADCSSATAPVVDGAVAQRAQQQEGDPSQEAEHESHADRQDSLASLLRQSSLGQLFRQESLAAMGSCSVGSGSAPQSPAMGTAAPAPSPALGIGELGPLPIGEGAQVHGCALRDGPTSGNSGRALQRPPSLQRGGSSGSLSGWHTVDWDAVALEALEGNILEDFLPPASSV